METRTHKWRYKRLELQTEKECLMNEVMNLSENLMKFHSGLLASKCFDDMMGDPIACLDDVFKIGNIQDWSRNVNN